MTQDNFELTAVKRAQAGSQTKNRRHETVAGLLLLLYSFIVPDNARADGSISIVPISGTEARVTVNHSGYWISTQNDPDYRVCWKIKGAWQGICDANKRERDEYNVFDLNGLVAGTTYKVKAFCYCAKDGKNVFKWRVMDVEKDYTHSTPPPPPTIVSSQRVRLRNVSTSQCLWIDGSRVRHWGCWGDPNQTFVVETYSNGMIYLRHEISSQCVWGKRSTNPSIASASCGTLGTQFQVNTVSGGVQLFIPLTKDNAGSGFSNLPGAGGCLFTDAIDGNDALKEKPCTAAAKFTFSLDPV